MFSPLVCLELLFHMPRHLFQLLVTRSCLTQIIEGQAYKQWEEKFFHDLTQEL